MSPAAQPVGRREVEHLAIGIAARDQGAPRSQQALDRIAFVQPLQRLAHAGNSGDSPAISANSSGNPGVGVRAEHRGQTEHGPAPCELRASSFRGQLLLRIRALEVRAGLVRFVHWQRVVRPSAVHGHRRSEHKRARSSEKHVAGALDVCGAHLQRPGGTPALPDLGRKVVQQVDALKGAPGSGLV